jgi:hypothetical protein
MPQDLMPLEPISVEGQPVTDVVAGPLIEQMDSFKNQFDQARNSRDPVQAYDLSIKARGTPIGEAAAHTANLYAKGAEDFKKLNDPIEKAGGLGTPAGNIAAVKVFNSTKDNPQYGSALIAMLMGQKDAAYRALTGGKEFNKVILDQVGSPVKLHTNEAGDLIDVQDVKTGKMLTPEEYANRGVGKYTSYESTLDYKTKAIQAEANSRAWAQSQATNNNWGAFGQALTPVVDRLKTLGNQPWFQSLSPEKQSQVLKFSSSAIGSASTAGKNTSNLGQLQALASSNEGKAVDKSIASAFGLPGAGWEWKGGMAVNTKTGQSRSVSELNQFQNSSNNSSELTNNFKQTQQDLATYLQTSGLDESKQRQVLDFIGTTHDVGQELLRMTREHGVPSYLYLPGALTSVDPKARIMAQAEQLGTIGELTKNFSAYANGIKSAGQPGDILPSPGAAENGFASTPFYQETVNGAKKRMNEIVMAPSPVQQSTTPVSPNRPKVTGVPPTSPKGVPAGAKKIGKTPDGRDVYEANGKKWTED